MSSSEGSGKYYEQNHLRTASYESTGVSGSALWGIDFDHTSSILMLVGSGSVALVLDIRPLSQNAGRASSSTSASTVAALFANSACIEAVLQEIATGTESRTVKFSHPPPSSSEEKKKNFVVFQKSGATSNDIFVCSVDLSVLPELSSKKNTNKRVEVINVDEPLGTLSIHSAKPRAIEITRDNSTLLSIGIDKILNVSCLKTFTVKRILNSHTDYCYTVALSLDEKYIASGNLASEVHVHRFFKEETSSSTSSSKPPQGDLTGTVGIIQLGKKSADPIFRVQWNKKGDRLAAVANDLYILGFNSSSSVAALNCESEVPLLASKEAAMSNNVLTLLHTIPVGQKREYALGLDMQSSSSGRNNEVLVVCNNASIVGFFSFKNGDNLLKRASLTQNQRQSLEQEQKALEEKKKLEEEEKKRKLEALYQEEQEEETVEEMKLRMNKKQQEIYKQLTEALQLPDKESAQAALRTDSADSAANLILAGKLVEILDLEKQERIAKKQEEKKRREREKKEREEQAEKKKNKGLGDVDDQHLICARSNGTQLKFVRFSACSRFFFVAHNDGKLSLYKNPISRWEARMVVFKLEKFAKSKIRQCMSEWVVMRVVAYYIS